MTSTISIDLPCPKCQATLSKLETLAGEQISFCHSCGWRPRPEAQTQIVTFTTTRLYKVRVFEPGVIHSV